METSGNKMKKRYSIFYALSAVALGGILLADFGVIYTLVVTPPEDPATVMKLVYLIMMAGFLVLAAQAVLVFSRLISRLGQERRTVETLQQELDQVSFLDGLTKVYNRYKFESVIKRELENVRRYANPVSGIMFDVDNFKALNEEHGYATGDKLLANMARFVSTKLRNTDYVFRWRGGKFIILAPHADVDKAAIIAEKLRQMVGHKLFGGKIRMSLSMGVVQGREDDNMETFLHRMQSALTRAKHQGRNCVVVARD
ncbi:diguanylate cyclase [Pseudodesulfovibrio cashew]|uniref:diguanylate cyclase n=1 Tax=Pseudodesulfovibrio cashew TaxID=2678688 RepID=A0A6I6JF79_9BACT|nr:GGDEF domain-containing protein [Pseudodesulfovibrio cashew]QGY39740.1 diguanylate cyclase [Pseudodesulfovibrio cashew]